MKISVDVYTKDIALATEVFTAAVESGATDVRLNSCENWDTKQFQAVNVMFEVDHSSEVLNLLDNGKFAKDQDDL